MSNLVPGIRPDGRRVHLHAPSVLNLCRTSMEAAARTIWLLSPDDRTTRRARTTCLAGKEWYEQGKFFEHSRELYRRDTAAERSQRAQHERTSNGYDAHPPHHRRADFKRNNLLNLARTTYNVSSGTVHGYKWVHEHVGDTGSGLFNVMADALAVSLTMTECAVALFEAQCLAPSSAAAGGNYPKRMKSTIVRWAEMYASSH